MMPAANKFRCLVQVLDGTSIWSAPAAGVVT